MTADRVPSGLLTAAIANNAAWCDAVCRSHRVGSVAADGIWQTDAAPPAYYPDLVTLLPQVPAAAVIDRLVGRHHCGVKDSFGVLDLSAGGFRPLFDASWIGIATPAPAPADPPEWSLVRTAAGLADWAEAAGLAGIIVPELLADPRIDVLRRSGREPGGAIAFAAAEVVSVSNVFGPETHPGLETHPGTETRPGTGDPDWWRSMLGVLSRLHPGRPVVGYESGSELSAAVSAGCAVLGPLRIWTR